MTAPDVTDSDEFSSKAALMRAFRTRRAFASLGAAYEASEDIPSNPNLGATFAGVAARRYGRRAVLQGALSEIGRASCRERVCQYVSISVVAESFKNKPAKTYIHNNQHHTHVTLIQSSSPLLL